MRNIVLHAVIMAVIAVAHLKGQSLMDQVDFKSGTLGGVHLYGVSIYSGYSSSAYPLANGLPSTPTAGLSSLGPDVNYGVSASLGWRRHRQRTNLSVMYSGTYDGMVKYSNLNGFSQSMSLNAGLQLSSKWTATFSASGQDMTLAQFLNQPTPLSVVSQLPASFDDLAAVYAIGQFSDAQVASMLTGAPLLESPARTLLAGNRILSYSGMAALSYAHSSRLSLQFSGVTAAGQFRNAGTSGSTQQNAMPRSTGLNAGLSLSYSLSPRTQVSVNASEMYAINHYQSAYITNVGGSIGRKMGQHWFLNANGGAAFTQVTKQVYGAPLTRQPIGSGSIGFRTYQHTLIGSYSRSSTDTYGFVVGTTSMASGSWSWRRPGSRWTVFASAGQQQMRGNGFANLSGWTASGGIGENLSSQMKLTAQYVYSTNSGTYVGTLNNLSIHSIRVSLGWAPQETLR